LTPRKATATSGERYRDGLGWSTAARNCDQQRTIRGRWPTQSFRFDVAEKARARGAGGGKGLAHDRIRSRLAEPFHVAETGYVLGDVA